MLSSADMAVSKTEYTVTSPSKIITKYEKSEILKTVDDYISFNQKLELEYPEENKTDIQGCLAEFKKFIDTYHEHRLSQACKDLENFEKKYQSTIAVANQSEKEFLSKFYEANKLLMNDCLKEYSYMKKVLEMIEDGDGWMTESVGKSLTTKYKKIPNTAFISLKLEAVLDIPLLNVLTLIYEIELWREWVPFLSQSECLKNVHRASKAVYMRMGLPPPLSDRDAFLAGIGVDLMEENGAVVVLSRSFDTDTETIERYGIDITKTQRNVKIEMNLAGFRIRPLGPSSCELIGLANIDPKINFLPARLINWFMRKACTLLFERMLKKAQVLEGTPWEKAMKEPEKAAFYEWLNEKVEGFLKKTSSDTSK